MAIHLYAIGQAVDLLPALGGVVRSKMIGGYAVKAQMPPLGNDLQYRIKSDAEPYDRVVLEHQLSSTGPRSFSVTASALGDSTRQRGKPSAPSLWGPNWDAQE